VEISENNIESPNKEVTDVLHKDVAGSKVANGVGHVLPES
jgi:hypothetical protein